MSLINLKLAQYNERIMHRWESMLMQSNAEALLVLGVGIEQPHEISVLYENNQSLDNIIQTLEMSLAALRELRKNQGGGSGDGKIILPSVN